MQDYLDFLDLYKLLHNNNKLKKKAPRLTQTPGNKAIKNGIIDRSGQYQELAR